MGITSATLRPSIDPVESERFTRSHRVGRSMSMFSFSNSVGRISEGEDLMPDSLMISLSSVTVVGWNVLKMLTFWGGSWVIE